jgi:hypothetical protein
MSNHNEGRPHTLSDQVLRIILHSEFLKQFFFNFLITVLQCLPGFSNILSQYKNHNKMSETRRRIVWEYI